MIKHHIGRHEANGHFGRSPGNLGDGDSRFTLWDELAGADCARRALPVGHGMRNVFFTYSMLARVSATMSWFGDAVSSTYQPR